MPGLTFDDVADVEIGVKAGASDTVGPAGRA